MNLFKKRIREIANVYDGPHATPKESNSGPIFLGIKNIKPEGGIDLSEIRHISDSEYEKWTKRVTPQKDDIVLSYEATLHRYAIIPDNFRGCLGRRMALVRVDKNEVDHKFLYFTFLTDAWRAFIDANKLIGATVDRISIRDFPDYFIHLPSLPIQRRIASILSAYDDLIENNLKRIRLLEEKAQLHYKELMQEMIFSKTKNEEYIKNCLTFYIGGGWGEENYKEGFTEPAFVIRGTDIAGLSKGDNQSVPFRFHKESNLASRKIQDGDIVFEVSGGSKDQPVGRSLLITGKLLEQFNNPVMCASFCKLLRPNEKVSSEFLYLYLLESYENGVIKQYEKHSASNIVNYGFEEFIDEQRVTIPEESKLCEFTELVKRIFTLINVLGVQNAKLREARDILLPRLMSGAIVV